MGFLHKSFISWFGGKATKPQEGGRRAAGGRQEGDKRRQEGGRKAINTRARGGANKKNKIS